MALGKSDGSVIINTKVDTSGFGTGVSNMKKQIGGLSGAVTKLGLAMVAAFAVKELVQFGKQAIELGSDLQEVQNVVDVTFTTMNEQVNEFAKNAAKAAGLSETMAKRYAGTFGAMAKSFGFAEAEAFDMSTGLTQLAGDVASFYNITQDEAYTKLKSVFTGETETLKDLGVVMTQSALNAFALSKGIGKTTDEMSEQEKVALRYQFVMSQLSAASGDFERTSDGWANQMRILSLNFDTFKANVGQALINIFTPLLKTINSLVEKLAALSQKFVSFSQLLMGNKKANNTTSNLKEIEQGYDDVADSIDKAKKAQTGYLSKIDELNAIKKSSDTTETSGAEFIDPAVAQSSNNELEETEGLLSVIWAKVSEIASLFAQSFANPFATIKDFLLELKDNLYTLFVEPFEKSKGTLLESVLGIKDGFIVLWNSVKPILGDLFYGVFDLYNKYIAPIFEKLAPKVQDLFENHLAPMFTKLGEFLATLGQGLLDIWEYWKPLMEVLVATLMPVVAPILEAMGEVFIDVFNTIFDAIGGLFDALSGLVEFIAGTFTGDWDRAWNGIVQIFTGIWAGLKSVVETFMNATIKLINGLIEGINNVSGAIGIPAIPTIPLYSLDIPMLAKGAVIPPNAPFMAMLGDQRNGTNIEAPADLIRQIVREESANAELLSYLADIARNTRETADKDVSVNIGDRDIARANIRGKKSMGRSLIMEG